MNTKPTYTPGDRVRVPAGAVLTHAAGGPVPHPYAGREGTVVEVRPLGAWPVVVQLDGDLAGPLSLAYTEVEHAPASGRLYGEGYDGHPHDDRTTADQRAAVNRAAGELDNDREAGR